MKKRTKTDFKKWLSNLAPHNIRKAKCNFLYFYSNVPEFVLDLASLSASHFSSCVTMDFALPKKVHTTEIFIVCMYDILPSSFIMKSFITHFQQVMFSPFPQNNITGLPTLYSNMSLSTTLNTALYLQDLIHIPSYDTWTSSYIWTIGMLW